MRLAWTTDIHLNHAALPAWDQFVEDIEDSRSEAILITGDISEGEDVCFQLRRLSEAVPQRIFFVLGNHDFYSSSIAATRQRVATTVREVPALSYLTDAGCIELSPGHFLLGEDGWGDATEGDYESSTVRLNDFAEIKDFRRIEPREWPLRLRDLGEESALRLQSKLDGLPEHFERVTIATHVPPFREACWYQGRTTDDNWAPFFVCGRVGLTLLGFADQHPDKSFTVLCGHTHHGGKAQLTDNLIVHTGAADYGNPRILRVLDC